MKNCNQPGPIVPSLICGAMASRGCACHLPPMPGRMRCFGRGGAPGSGAPSGERNGRFRTGRFTREAKSERRWVRAVVGGDTEEDDVSMTQIETTLPTGTRRSGAVAREVKAPVRADVQQGSTADEFHAAPPDGQSFDDWLSRLKAVLGTASDDFVAASLRRLIYACRLPGHSIATGESLSAALAIIQALAPANEAEAMVAVHISSLHAASTAMLARLAAGGTESRVHGAATALAKLERAHTAQMSLYHRLKHGHRQTIRIERLEVQTGAQAVVGQIGT